MQSSVLVFERGLGDLRKTPCPCPPEVNSIKYVLTKTKIFYKYIY